MTTCQFNEDTRALWDKCVSSEENGCYSHELLPWKDTHAGSQDENLIKLDNVVDVTDNDGHAIVFHKEKKMAETEFVVQCFYISNRKGLHDSRTLGKAMMYRVNKRNQEFASCPSEKKFVKVKKRRLEDFVKSTGWQHCIIM